MSKKSKKSIFLSLFKYNIVFPVSFIQALEKIPGLDIKAFLDIHNQANSIPSIRLNPFKSIDKSFLSHLSIENAVPWSKHGYYLSSRPSFTFDPYFHAGAYYVQEASSMFIEYIINHIKQINNQKEWKILDACAAPGGKTTILSTAFPTSLLVANEVIRSRANILVDNIIKWGNSSTIVTQNDPAQFSTLSEFFNLMLIDAPCSGSGLFRKNKDAIAEWSPNNVQLCCERQQRIIHDLLPALAQDGYLIYATCSYSIEENENIVDEIMHSNTTETIRIPLESNWGIEEVITNQKAYCYRFWPYKVKGEGFFVACFKKRSPLAASKPALWADRGEERKRVQQKSEREYKKSLLSIVNKWFQPKENMHYYEHNENVYALPEHIMNDYNILKQYLYIKRAGINIGKIIRDDLIPEHDLAMSNLLADNIIKIDVDYTTAIQYLRKENIQLHTNYKGWVIICYNGMPLGWAKILSNRINNYYPSSLKIINQLIIES